MARMSFGVREIRPNVNGERVVRSMSATAATDRVLDTTEPFTFVSEQVELLRRRGCCEDDFAEWYATLV